MNEDVQIDADEPNQEYETQYFGFTPSTAVDEGNRGLTATSL